MAELKEYMRAKLKLQEDIQQGVYPVGSQLPTEREMCELFSVSRITVRQALTELEKDGYIKRMQGRGTFVESNAPQRQKSVKYEQLLSSNYSFSEELRKMGVVPSTRVLSLTRIPARPPLTTLLQVEEGHMVDVLLRLRLADNSPYAYETSYIPSEFLGCAVADEIARNGLYNTMEAQSGIRPNRAMETFEAAIAPEIVAEALGRQGVLSIMQMERTAYHDGRIVEYCTSCVAGDKYRFRVKLE